MTTTDEGASSRAETSPLSSGRYRRWLVGLGVLVAALIAIALYNSFVNGELDDREAALEAAVRAEIEADPEGWYAQLEGPAADGDARTEIESLRQLGTAQSADPVAYPDGDGVIMVEYRFTYLGRVRCVGFALSDRGELERDPRANCFF